MQHASASGANDVLASDAVEENPPTTSAASEALNASAEIPALLAARLAEAADGTRTGEDAFFVATILPHPTEPGHDLTGAFRTAAQAEQAEPEKLATGLYDIFGPYETQENPNYKRKKVVAKVTIDLKDAISGADAGQIVLLGNEADAIFWSLSAVEKFVIPYYVGIAGVAEGARLQEDFMDETTVLLRHIPGSRYSSEALAIEQKLNNPGLQLMTDPDGVMKIIPQ